MPTNEFFYIDENNTKQDEDIHNPILENDEADLYCRLNSFMDMLFDDIDEDGDLVESGELKLESIVSDDLEIYNLVEGDFTGKVYREVVRDRKESGQRVYRWGDKDLGL